MSVPAHYTRLGPFRELFDAGLPILMYHKVGPRPRGARLKGLYTSPALFHRQISELKAAGYTTTSLDEIPGGQFHFTQRVLLTFDDGFENVLRYALPELVTAQFQSIEYLVTDRLGGVNDWEMAEGEIKERLMDASQIREWLAADQVIGSHTKTHPYLTRLPLEQAREEITGSKKKLEDLFARPIRHFCYPYGDFNPAIADLVREAGYSTACTTISGINSAATSPYEMHRFTVRYRSRSLRSLRQSIQNLLGKLA